MALTLHNLRPAKGAKKRKKRLGRGHGSGLGTFAGRGMKGQKSRSGGKGGLILKGIKANIQNIPKLGGFRSLKPKMEVVNVGDLEKNFKEKDIITPVQLLNKNLIKTHKPGVKILGVGKITKKFTVKVNGISESAKQAIEAAGGKVFLIKNKFQPAKDVKTDKKNKKA